MYRLTILLLALSALFLVQCSFDDSEEEPQYEPIVLTENESLVAKSSDKFGLELFRQINIVEETGKNIFISPLSLSFALGMAYNGAANETRDAIADALQMPDLTIEEINESYLGLMENLMNVDPEVTMQIANSVWCHDRSDLIPAEEFVENCNTYFDAIVQTLDFEDPNSADIINQWVSDKTNDKIDSIIDAGQLRYLISLLLNAIYFNGTWTYEFDEADTRTKTFYKSDSSEVDCEMMYVEANFETYWNNRFEAIDMPYGHDYFIMTAVKPNPGVSLDSLIYELTAENWTDWTDHSYKSEIEVGLPKFTFEYKISSLLIDVLTEMGMGITFDPILANFDNLFPDDPYTFISMVTQKTFVRVDEKGTEAAAVSAVGMSDSAPGRLIFDSPFIFIIRERSTGTIIFMGKIEEPVWNELAG